MSRITIFERYEHDPLFRSMVDVLQGWIEQMQATPTEVREAAMLAVLMVEQRWPTRAIVFTAEQIRDGLV